jgi:heat shock protein HslJ
MRTLGALLMLGLLTACAVKPTASHQLAESEWEFVSIDDERPVSNAGSLRFTDGKLVASIGCNNMGGNWRIENGRLIAGPMEMTEMGCIEANLFSQERALTSLLAAAPELELKDGRLVLQSRGHNAELRRISPPQQSS